MKAQWKPSDNRVFGYLAVEHTVTKELTLASKHGEIYPHNDKVATILIKSPKVASKVLFMHEAGRFSPISKGEEMVIKVPASEVATYFKLLRIPKTRNAQCRILNAEPKVSKTTGFKPRLVK